MLDIVSGELVHFNYGKLPHFGITFPLLFLKEFFDGILQGINNKLRLYYR